ncbi:glycerol kinase GlpK [Legionella micdadei]|uniref:Glycerol kinase n=1 Tax=Legionella micdadei TaxID=451 RepID=A0A098GF60_LEGMI|nr:glycerol kinase GlpK [Legionella micdadei]ARG97411.1 glycerol kinase [Legionella micdadei]ARH00279.1 glycerol kinase [Legionella micdadei]KTD28302.1 glycerol kinase [Legionella micdadei]NSL16929.1 glycerol kinase GlpK [Legionella micdadei]CEG61109.1 Glycerol kinase [Legionella micdadei]
MTYLLAIDQGTSSTRAMLYTSTGKLVLSRQYPLTQYYPKPGWVEHDPEEIWKKTLQAMKDVLEQIDKNKVLACGITNQRETTLIWDKQTGQCLAPAIVWQDRRTHDFCESLSDEAEGIQKKTGLLPDPYFSGSKLHWLLKNIPGAKELAVKNRLAFGTVDSFLIWRLTKNNAHLTDITNASRTLLFNIVEQEWDEELLKLFAVPDAILPRVYACDADFGLIDNKYFGVSIPITGVAGDQQAALIGQRCLSVGMIKATFGTGGFLLMNTGCEPILSNHKLLTTIAYRMKGQTHYGLEGSLYQAGTTVKWLRDELKLIKSASDTEVLAKSLSGNDGVYLVPSFTGLGAPHWITTPGAMIVGLARTSNRAHFARAALESVCYQTREIITCMRESSEMDLLLLRVDGGMAANSWFLQFLSSQCKLAVQKPQDIETTAQGAALIAAIGCGLIGSLDTLQESWIYEQEFIPETNEQVEEDFSGWKRALRMVKAG